MPVREGDGIVFANLLLCATGVSCGIRKIVFIAFSDSGIPASARLSPVRHSIADLRRRMLFPSLIRREQRPVRGLERVPVKLRALFLSAAPRGNHRLGTRLSRKGVKKDQDEAVGRFVPILYK